LHSPSFLNIKILPEDYKNLVKDRFLECQEWVPRWGKNKGLSDERVSFYKKEVEKLLSGYLKYMFSEDLSGQLPKFWEYTKKLDKIREQDVSLVFPELAHSVKSFLDRS